MVIRNIFAEFRHPTRWRDMAEVVLEKNPDAQPQRGMCFISDDKMWTVARVDVRDESKGWAVWMGQRRIGDHLFFGTVEVAKAFAFLASIPIRGLAQVLRVVARGRRLWLDAAALLARAASPPAPSGTTPRRAETFADRERGVTEAGRLLERVEGYEFADAPGAVAFRCLATAAKAGPAAAMVGVPRRVLLQPTEARLMYFEGNLCIAGTQCQVRQVVERAHGLDGPSSLETLAADLSAQWRARIEARDIVAALEYVGQPDEIVAGAAQGAS